MPDTRPPAPEPPTPEPPARKRRRIHTSLVFGGNVAALATWAALYMAGVLAALGKAAEEDGSLGGIALELAFIALFPVVISAAAVAVFVTVAVVPLGVRWCRAAEHPLLPGLSFAHLLVAWGMAAVFAGSRLVG